MSTQADQDFAVWLKFHKPQLDAIQLPEALHRKIWQKVTFEDFDIGSTAKIIKDENTETTDLMCTKNLAANSDVFLIDHAWTFRYQDAFDTLKQNAPLLERLQKMLEDIEKQDLPEPEAAPEEEKKQEAKPVETAFLKGHKTGGTVFDLDNLDIVSLKSLPKFPETTEQISLFGNGIENPNDIAELLVPLPELRALWLNGNPVVETCSNFNMISDLMPKLEILNSQLTNKAGEWAMMFYAKNQQGVTSLEEVETLDLSGKGVLYMPSADIFARMTKLRKLDLCDHPEFFMTAEIRQQVENEALDGLGNKENVNFMECLIQIDDILANLNALEELKCGYSLEEYICKMRQFKNFLPKLKLVNGISVDLINMTERDTAQDIIAVIKKLPLIANCYIVGQGMQSQAVWYVHDEVGTIIGHSDTPNIRVRSFINSPASQMNDENRLEVSVMWPIKDIGTKHAFCKDNLQGFTEQNGFRSARLFSWYDTPLEYFTKQLGLVRSAMPTLDIEQGHSTIQDDSPLKGTIVNDTNEPIRVFTDVPEAMTTLTDARFEFVTDFETAQIFWLIGHERNTHLPKAIEKNGYLNEFPCDDVLLVKDMFIPLLHSSYRCFEKENSGEPDRQEPLIQESYMANTQLPAFVGRFNECEEKLEDNTWAVIGGQLPEHAPVLPAITNCADWAMRLTEAGPSASIIQKYQDRPLLTPAGHKMIFRFSVYLKSVVPLQAYISKKVQVINAPKPFTMEEPSFADEGVHLCSVTSPEDFFGTLPDSDDLLSKSVDAIRSVLKAFQVQFGDEIKQAGEEKKRAIYTVAIQFDAAKMRPSVQGFSFSPSDNLDYNEAFKALFFDEVAGLAQI